MYPKILLSWNFRPVAVGSMFEAPNAGRGVWWEIYSVYRDPYNRNLFHITIRQAGWAVGSQVYVISKEVCPIERVLWIEPWDVAPVVYHKNLQNMQWGLEGYWHKG